MNSLVKLLARVILAFLEAGIKRIRVELRKLRACWLTQLLNRCTCYTIEASHLSVSEATR